MIGKRKIDLAEAQGSQRKRRVIRFSVTAAPLREIPAERERALCFEMSILHKFFF